MSKPISLNLFTILLTPAVLLAQAPFSGFSPGNIVVTRSVYTGDATTVTVGQPLPPVCPSTAACGTAVASDNGAYPSISSTNNVFNNDKADGNFGITSPIFIDQMTTAGTLIDTFAVPPNMLTTSFSSKSELSINLSEDGTALTLMGYVAPPNAIDVSNSNAPGVYDPTNPSAAAIIGLSYRSGRMERCKLRLPTLTAETTVAQQRSQTASIIWRVTTIMDRER